MKLKRTNKLLALLLAVLMVVSLLPMSVLATPNDTVTEISTLANPVGTYDGANVNVLPAATSSSG